MNTTDILLFAGTASFFYYFMTQQFSTPGSQSVTTQPAQPATQEESQPPTETPTCPDNTVFLPDQNVCCAHENIQPDGTCGSCPYHSTQAKDESGNDVCCPDENLDSNNVCQQCPIGTTLSADGSACEASDGTPSVTPPGYGLNIPTTGNQIGDVAVQMGLGVTSGLLIDKGVETSFKAVTSTTSKVATKVGTEVAEDVAIKSAQMIAKKEGAKLGQKFATKVGVKVAGKMAGKLATVTATASTGIGIVIALVDLIMMAIVMVLEEVLSLDPDSFQPDGPNQWSLESLPDWANIILTSIPLFGNIIDILTPVLVFNVGCGENQDNEANICYDKPKPIPNSNDFWECQGFLCYLHSPEFENNGQLSTFANVTKNIMMDTGQVPTECPEGATKDGALCYFVDPGATLVGGTEWFSCPDGYTDQGALCSSLSDSGVGRIPDKRGCGDFSIQNCRDDGTSLWSDLSCSTYCDSTWDSSNGGFCHTNCSGTGGIVKTLGDRQLCNADEDLVDSMCYAKCPSGTTRNGLLCGQTITKQSKVLTPQAMVCSSDKMSISGLCYQQIPDGYERQSLGLLSQKCLDGWLDVGVACQRPTYTREPSLGLTASIRDRRHTQQDYAPKSCSERGLTDPADLAKCNAMVCDADSEITSSQNGSDFCVTRCRESYQSAPNGICMREAGGQDLNGNPFTADSYQRRAPMLIDWGDNAADSVRVTQSTWDEFNESGGQDVGEKTFQSNPTDFNFSGNLRNPIPAGALTGQDLATQQTNTKALLTGQDLVKQQKITQELLTAQETQTTLFNSVKPVAYIGSFKTLTRTDNGETVPITYISTYNGVTYYIGASVYNYNTSRIYVVGSDGTSLTFSGEPTKFNPLAIGTPGLYSTPRFGYKLSTN